MMKHKSGAKVRTADIMGVLSASSEYCFQLWQVKKVLGQTKIIIGCTGLLVNGLMDFCVIITTEKWAFHNLVWRIFFTVFPLKF